MPKYNIAVQVINNYEVVADSEEEAIEIYSTFELEVSDYKTLDDIQVTMLEEGEMPSIDYTTFSPEEFIEGKILKMNEANETYRNMAKTIGADTTQADAVMGRGTENRLLLRAIYQRLNEIVGEEE